MASNTPNYNFILPGVNDPADADLWGGYLNQNWTDLDTDLKTVSDVADAALAAATTSQLPTGINLAYSGTTAPSGWIFYDGLTIGSATSGATSRANADTEDLYTLLWNAYSNTICPVSGGRGASAAADFAANKTLTVLDMRGRVIAGRDNMGGSAANRITNAAVGITGTTLGASGGSQTQTLSVSQMPLHGHPFQAAYASGVASNTTGGMMVDDDNDNNYAAHTGAPSAAQGQQIGGTGGGAAHENVQPTIIQNWIVKL